MRPSSLLLLLPFVLGACASETPRTQVMVSIEASPEIAAAAYSLRVEVIRDDADPFDMVYDDDALTLPFIVGVIPRGGDVDRRFTVRASLGATPFQYQAQVEVPRFVEGRTLWVRLQITDACRSSCNQGVVVPEDLPDWPGEAALRTDAGSGGMDAGEGDAGVDAATGDAGCVGDDDCDDGDQCTDDDCVAGSCVHANNASLCDDDDVCSSLSACADGVCRPIMEVACGENQLCTDEMGSAVCVCADGFVACGAVCIPVGTCCDSGSCAGSEICPAPGGSCGCPADAPVRCEETCHAECCPGATSDCGNCGSRTCGTDGRWGACTDEGACRAGESCYCSEPGGCTAGFCQGCGYQQQRICNADCSIGGCFGG